MDLSVLLGRRTAAILDADAACDANFFVPLCRTLIEEQA